MKEVIGMSISIREEIEQTIKEFSLNRLFFHEHEVSKISYAAILEKIEKSFIWHGRTIHWANIENRFAPQLSYKTKYIGDNYLWFEQLPDIIPNKENPFYVLFEDSKNMQPKYWLYEACLNELIVILREVSGIADYYLVSKKMDWLISECHEDIVYFVGDSLLTDSFREIASLQ